MDAVGTDGQRDIEPVVDDQRDAAARNSHHR
jgi:hypothetical protein